MEYTPTILIVLFEEERKKIAQIEGADKIRGAIRSGAAEALITAFMEQRVKLRMADRLAEQMALRLALGVAMASAAGAGAAAARRRREEELRERFEKDMERQVQERAQRQVQERAQRQRPAAQQRGKEDDDDDEVYIHVLHLKRVYNTYVCSLRSRLSERWRVCCGSFDRTNCLQQYVYTSHCMYSIISPPPFFK